MKKISVSAILFFLLVFISCTVDPVKNVQSVPNLISEKFISDTEYEIVCIGYPKEGLKGIQKEESSKRAALLNAYYFTRNRFDDTVLPDVDGKTEKLTVYDDYAEIKYIIKKSDLKKRIKK